MVKISKDFREAIESEKRLDEVWNKYFHLVTRKYAEKIDAMFRNKDG